MSRWTLIAGTSAIGVALLGAGYWAFSSYLDSTSQLAYDPVFNDAAQTNTQVTPDQLALAFTDPEGHAVTLEEYRGRKNVLLVFMRGFAGSVCPNCSAQTSRLIRNHAEFVKRGAEVLVVVPGPKDHLAEFLKAGRDKANRAEIPFRILLDPDFVAVDKLGIRGFLAKPSTYILDKQGQLRFAYVGAYTSDRPSIQAMLGQLDQLNES